MWLTTAAVAGQSRPREHIRTCISSSPILATPVIHLATPAVAGEAHAASLCIKTER